MKILVTVFIILFSCLHTTAGQKWFQGVVVLSSGEVKVGLLQYHPRWSAVSFKIDTDESLVETFPVSKLAQFSFFDEKISVWRRFHIFAANRNGYVNPVIYEVVFRGEFSLLRKEKSIEPNYNNYDPTMTSGLANEQVLREQILAFNFFFYHNNKIVPLADFKKYAREEAFFEELDTFANTHRLSWRVDYDIVMMMNYLNCSSGTGCLEGFDLTRMASSH